jgi:hypothetical protein
MTAADSAKLSAIDADCVSESLRATALAFIRRHGWKRGLAAFADALGVTDRRARALYAGEARRIEALEYLRAAEARLLLLDAERAKLETAPHGLVPAPSRRPLHPLRPLAV